MKIRITKFLGRLLVFLGKWIELKALDVIEPTCTGMIKTIAANCLTKFAILIITEILQVQWGQVSRFSFHNHMCRLYWQTHLTMEIRAQKKHAIGHEAWFKQRSNNKHNINEKITNEDW